MINFDRRLQTLKARRQGSRERAILDSLNPLEATRAIASGTDVRKKEHYENLKESPGIRYAIGSMARVDDKSTQVSIKEGERVADNVVNRLNAAGEHVEKKLQGSVALDIHIMGHSDVDMLVLVNQPIIVQHPVVDTCRYSASSDFRNTVDIVKDVRLKSETILTNGFPAANVDCKGNKSIAIEGGSLARKVDIVPAIWYDTIQYQENGYEFQRGVKIYHKGDHELILNYPFKHIAYINVKDSKYNGNLKSVTRLLKNLVADMPDYKKVKAKKLSSYDLASIAYTMNEKLKIPEYFQLGLVENSREHLSMLINNAFSRNILDVPDGSRKIFNSADKVEALEIIASEITDLSIAISKEIAPYMTAYDNSLLLNKAVI